MNVYQIAPVKDGFEVTVTSKKNRTQFSSLFQTKECAAAWVARRQSIDTLSDVAAPINGRRDGGAGA
jgi:hypothetical protein